MRKRTRMTTGTGVICESGQVKGTGVNTISKIAKEYGTPFYLFDIDKLFSWVDEVNNAFGIEITRGTGVSSEAETTRGTGVSSEAETTRGTGVSSEAETTRGTGDTSETKTTRGTGLPGKVELCYAIKANTFLLPYMLEKVNFLEVCSPGEFQICKKNNVDSKHIIFSGVVKYKEDILALFEDEFNGTITLESPKHFELLKEVVNELHISHVKVLPRLSSGNKFGMSKSEIKNIIKECQVLNQSSTIFEVTGIQYFSGTQKKRLSVYEKELKELDDFIEEIKSELSVDITFIEYGPGMLYDYYDDVDQLNVARTVYENLKPYLNKYHFTLEIGRYFAAYAGSYVTKVVDVKHTDDKNYALVDGGIHHVNYYGRMLGMNEPDVKLFRKSGENFIEINPASINNTDSNEIPADDNSNATVWEIGGALCTVNDVLLRNYECDEILEGDLFIFNDTGAYSPMEAPVLFLSRTMPAIFSVRDGQITMLRDFKEAWELNC